MREANGRPGAGRAGAWLALAGAVAALDQATKAWAAAYLPLGAFERVTPFFNLCHVHNRGAAFSFLSEAGGWQTAFFLALGAVMCAVLAALLYRRRGEILAPLGFALVIGGALGNMIDRATAGVVVDFLDFHAAGWHWPAFNVADIAICCGAGLVVLLEWGAGSRR
ncbi:MAG: lipoprotein signal peptidase [Duodenibacillus sp.]|nr:lipoprotein signal peptidase [Duodenibacillus sp.]